LVGLNHFTVPLATIALLLTSILLWHESAGSHSQLLVLVLPKQARRNATIKILTKCKAIKKRVKSAMAPSAADGLLDLAVFRLAQLREIMVA
jgi:hypothetical protein